MIKKIGLGLTGLLILVTGLYHLGQFIAKERKKGYRQEFFETLKTTQLDNCQIKRYGDFNDGGYALCSNLLKEVQSIYSYGIEGRDKWGCQTSTELKRTTHEYDCFNSKQPQCAGGKLAFHGECVGAIKETSKEGRTFDSITNHIAKNGDSGKKILMKMDVEEAEWDSLMTTKPEILQNIEQLTIELHHVNDKKYAGVINYLKQFFYVVDVHFNNVTCTNGGDAPFPAWAIEVLFVNKRIAKPSANQPGPRMTTQFSNKNAPQNPDCQIRM